MKLTTQKDGTLFSHELKCGVKRITYDFVAKRGQAVLVGCSDWAIIAFFLRIDSKVSVIETFDEGEADTVYRLLPDGQWQARFGSFVGPPGAAQ